MGVCAATVSRGARRAGLSRLSELQPAELGQRYEHPAPGEMLHIGTKRLGRIVRPSHRVTGNRKDSVNGAGSQMLSVAIDHRVCIAFTAMRPHEKSPQAARFLCDVLTLHT